jgi:PKD repeat protein
MQFARLRLSFAAILLAASGAFLLVLTTEAEANHFRGGTMYATPTDPSDPLTVRLHAIVYVRCGWTGNTCAGYGPVQAPNNCFNTPMDCQYPPGIAFPTQGILGKICFGDGECVVDWIARQYYADTIRDWVGYEAWEVGGIEPGILHTYGHEGAWNYYLTHTATSDASPGCCHMSYGPTNGQGALCSMCRYWHYNNPNRPYRLDGMVTLPANQPYKTNMKPIESCEASGCSISLAATYAPPGTSYAARMATPPETGSNNWYQPGPCVGCGSPATTASITSTAVPQWQWVPGPEANCPTGEFEQGYYSTSVQLLGNGTDRVPLEWMVTCKPQLLDPPSSPQPSSQGSVLAPRVSFSYKQNALCGVSSVQFTDESSPRSSLRGWHWDFGDGADSTEQNPSHTYSENSGTYKVKLTVTDENGAAATRARLIALAESLDCPTQQQPRAPVHPTGPPRDGTDAVLAGLDTDNDGTTDRLDLCPSIANPGQKDLDGDDLGDACDVDADNDGIPNLADNCSQAVNPQQDGGDNDASGDACYNDVANDADYCMEISNAQHGGRDGNGVDDWCQVMPAMVPVAAAGTEVPREDSIPPTAAAALIPLVVIVPLVIRLGARRKQVSRRRY